MKERFEGSRGRTLRIDAFKEQCIVEHDAEIATALADAVELIEYPPGDVLVTQGASDNSLLFILSGETAVLINGRVVGARNASESIGEMAILSPTARRSATVQATKLTLAGRISEEAFAEIASKFPRIWKSIAKLLANRLRERAKFHRAPNPLPIMFIGSSVESLPIAHAIIAGLKHDKVIPRLWSTPGVFSPGGATLETLLTEVERADFAVFVFGPDDKLASRDGRHDAPRDNVVFELGLFMGRIDRARALIVKEHNVNIKIPSDLFGITPITYVSKPGQDLPTTIEPVCSELRRAVAELGAI